MAPAVMTLCVTIAVLAAWRSSQCDFPRRSVVGIERSVAA